MKKTRNKVTRSHSTSIEATEPFLVFAKNHNDITKISLGIIKPIKTVQQKRIKCTLEQACILLQIRGNRAIQEIRFFTDKLQQLKSELETLARNNDYEVSK
jgi:hypothetical protein